MRRFCFVITGLLLITMGVQPGSVASAAVGRSTPWDFNGDGFADLAVGVPGEEVLFDQAGAVSVLYGSPSGPTADGDQLWSQASPGIEGRPSEFDNFGATEASGDFDGDGFADLAVTVLGDDLVLGNPLSGAVHILYGSALGLTAERSQLWNQGSPGLREPGGERFGFSLAAADFDGDGVDDIAIGVPGQQIGGLDAVGAVQILYGSPTGLSSDGNQLLSRKTPGIKGEGKEGQLFGKAVAGGEFNGDGAHDLAIGAPSGTVGNDEGSVSAVYGSANGLTPAGNQLWRQDSPGIGDQSEDGDVFGSSLAAGDFGLAPRDDLAIEIPGESVGDVQGAGAVAILYGRAAGLTATGNQLWTQDTPGVEEETEIGDGFGWSLAAGNFGVPGVGETTATTSRSVFRSRTPPQ